MKKLTLLALSLWLSSSCFGDTLVVLNKSDSTASLVDLSNLKIVASVKTGEGPHEVAVSPDGRQAVITNYGDKAAGSSLTVIDLESATVAKTIQVGHKRPHGIAWIPDTSEVLVTSEESQCVVRVDIEQGQVLNTLPTKAKLSHMLAVNRDRAYVANIGSGSVSVLDLERQEFIAEVKSGKGSEGIELRPDSHELWISNRGEDSLTVLDTDSNKITHRLESQAFPIRVKFAPHRPLALVTNTKSGTLNFFDANAKKLLSTLQFPKGNGDSAGRMFGELFKDSSAPIGIAIDPARNRAFVAHANLDKISVIDLETFNVVDQFQAGREPDGMAYSACSVQVSSP